MKYTLAIDIGDVAVKKGTDYEDENSNYIVEFYPNFLETISKLKEEGNELFFNSYCGPEREKKIKDYFRTVEEITKSIPETNWIFIRDKKEKPIVCNKIKADIFIDDNFEICKNVRKNSKTKHIIWFNETILKIIPAKKQDSNNVKKQQYIEDRIREISELKITQLRTWIDVYQFIHKI